MTNVCPCAFHQRTRLLRHSDSKKVPIFPEDLRPGEADRCCSEMGCEQVVSKLNSRFHRPYNSSLCPEFSMHNPFVRESLMLCMWLRLDFGTVYARFRACVLAEDAGICTAGRTCTERRLFFGNCINSISSKSAIAGGRKLQVPCLFSDLDPRFDPNNGTLLQHVSSQTHNPILEPQDRIGRPREYLTSAEIWRPPRRIWDLAAHRVIPAEALQAQCPRIRQGCKFCRQKPSPGPGKLITEFWAISHSWVAANRRQGISAKTNGYQWKIPMPVGVTLEFIAMEVKTLIASRPCRGRSWSFYCWLDLLCIRQQSPGGPSELEQLRESEWSFDVPTIGSIYRAAVGTVRYFNGLGKPFTASGWDDERHWLKRAWTLQEIKPEPKTLNGGLSARFSGNSNSARNVNQDIPLNTMGYVAHHREKRRLRDVLKPLTKLAYEAEVGHCSIITLFQEMRHRYATTDRDKISGINYLLSPEYLPLYKIHEDANEAWRRSIHLLPRASCLELIFNFPFCSRGGPARASWAPSWAQIAECSELDTLLPIEDTVVMKDTAKLMAEAGIIYRESCFTMDVNLWVVRPSFASPTGTVTGNHEYKVAGEHLTSLRPRSVNSSSYKRLEL